MILKKKGKRMENKLTPELNKLKTEFDFLHQKIGELEWELATRYYGKRAVLRSEIDMIEAQLGNYRENIGILLEKVEDEVRKANELNRSNK